MLSIHNSLGHKMDLSKSMAKRLTQTGETLSTIDKYKMMIIKPYVIEDFMTWRKKIDNSTALVPATLIT